MPQMAKIQTSTFIERCKSIYGDLYDYSETKYERHNMPVTITCKNHGRFTALPKNLYRNLGCKGCKSNKKENQRIEDEKLFIADAKRIHDGFYDYDQVKYVNKKTKVIIICPTHGSFEQDPEHHIQREQGCRDCAIEEKANQRRKTLSKFIEEAIEIHGNLYDYSLVEYKNNRIKVKILCRKHGIFETTPSHHLRGQDCSNCAEDVGTRFKAKTTQKFIDEAKEIHDNMYDYKQVEYINNKIKVKITCQIHGVFEQSPKKHLAGQKCKKCVTSGKYRLESKCRDIFEKKFNEPFKSVRPDFLKNPKSGCNLELDGYNEQLKLAFEYNGEQHYILGYFSRNEEDLEYTKWKDNFKAEKCKELDINLIVIPYWIEEDKLEEHIFSKLEDLKLCMIRLIIKSPG